RPSCLSRAGMRCGAVRYIGPSFISNSRLSSGDGRGRESGLCCVMHGLANSGEGVVAADDVVERDATCKSQGPPLDDLAPAADHRVEAEQSTRAPFKDELHEPGRYGVARECVVGTQDVAAGVRGCLDLE